MKKSKPLEFLAKAQEDPKISARVLKAVERGGNVTTDEVIEIAAEFGYKFTRKDFEKEVKRQFGDKFAASDTTRKRATKKPIVKKPPMSSCGSGCLSYTTSWHPSDRTF